MREGRKRGKSLKVNGKIVGELFLATKVISWAICTATPSEKIIQDLKICFFFSSLHITYLSNAAAVRNLILMKNFYEAQCKKIFGPIIRVVFFLWLEDYRDAAASYGFYNGCGTVFPAMVMLDIFNSVLLQLFLFRRV